MWVCQKCCQISGPDWWSEFSLWSTPSISSVRTTWSVSANTPNSCSRLVTFPANSEHKCVTSRVTETNSLDTSSSRMRVGCNVWVMNGNVWLYIQVSRAFIAARALSQGLATGRDIVNKATKVSGFLSYSSGKRAFISHYIFCWQCKIETCGLAVRMKWNGLLYMYNICLCKCLLFTTTQQTKSHLSWDHANYSDVFILCEQLLITVKVWEEKLIIIHQKRLSEKVQFISFPLSTNRLLNDYL